MFERFTDEARRSIICAQEESKALGHDRIGTEHLLLGLFHDDVGGAAVTLQSFGVTLDAARDAVVALVGRGDGPSHGHIPFTPRAKRVLERSLRAALKLDHSYIGSEHLLLGLLDEGEGAAADLFAGLAIDPREARRRARSALAAAPPPGSPPGPTSPPPFAAYDQANRQARDLARQLETVRAAKDAALDDGDATQAITLRKRERMILAVRAGLLRDIAAAEAPPTPPPAEQPPD
ncbi:Clp protease N-terminal domain-containing protein [Pseudofrankia inefficax]|nr:Clp protease N-terminal domain-containing protein [Pseudofrankia inefficax]